MIPTYLRKLKATKSLEKSFIAKYLTNLRLVTLLVISIIVFGLATLVTLPKRLNPEINIAFVNVVTTLPGGAPQEVESLVTGPIEEAIEGAESLTSTTSFSQENVSIITLEFETGTDPGEAKDDIQSLVDTVTDLPEDAGDPNVSSFDFENQPIFVATISTNAGAGSLENFVNSTKDKLENLNSINNVSVSGLEGSFIEVLIDPEAVSELNINPLTLKNQISAAVSSFPSGNVDANGTTIPFTIERTLNTVEEIAELPLKVGEDTVSLGSVAHISKKPNIGALPAFTSIEGGEPERASVLTVFKTKLTEIDTAANDAKGLLNAEIENSNFSLLINQNTADEINEQFLDLGISFTQTVALVFITLFLFLGLKQGALVAISIPITFLISFGIMGVTGLTLNFVSVFALLLGMGLLVDDAIVITSAMTTYFKTGKFTNKEAGLLVWKDFIVPIWSTTITTVWAFVPLLLSTGIIGEFIKSIPIVVSTTLLASTTTAVLITLPVMMFLFKPDIPKRVIVLGKIILLALLVIPFAIILPRDPLWLYISTLTVYAAFLSILYLTRQALVDLVPRVSPANGVINLNTLAAKYKIVIESILVSKAARIKVIVAVVVFAVMSYALVPAGYVINEFFPKVDTDLVFINVELPSGTTIERTQPIALEVFDEVKGLEGVQSAYIQLGRLTNLGDGLVQEGEHTAAITLNLKEENSILISERLRNQLATFEQAKVSVIEPSAGPPVGADVQVKYLGDDFAELEKVSDETLDFLLSLPGIINAEKSVDNSTSKLSFTLNDSRVAELGLSPTQIGFWTRTYLSGFTLDNVKFGDEEKEIVFRISDNKLGVSELGRIMIPAASGPVPLVALGDLTLSPNPNVITRENGKRVVSVTAGVDSDFSVGTINSQITDFANEQDLPEGVKWETGGVNDENQESVNSIMQAMILSAILILATMVVQLGSFRKSIIVLLVIPLAISGVFVLFALSGTPLSFPSLIGVLALFGIVVNNSIMLVEKINQNLAAKIPFAKAIAEGAESRVEPILLSSLTTIIGLIPITLSNPLWRGLGGAIIAGLSVSGIIMLFFIPVVYFSWFQPKK